MLKIIFSFLIFFPLINNITLAIYGKIEKSNITMICGISYCILSFTFVQLSPLFYLITIVQFFVFMISVSKKKKRSFSEGKVIIVEEINDNLRKTKVTSTNSSINKQKLNQKDSKMTIKGTQTKNFNYSGSFFDQMRNNANLAGLETKHVPFMSYWSTYDAMTSEQLDWYLYLRTQIRENNYIDTDLSYIFVYIYELINCVGVINTEDGLTKLKNVWFGYRNRHEKLDNYLFCWTFDYANVNNLEYFSTSEITALKLNNSSEAIVNVIIDKYQKDELLKLPLNLIDALCDYSIVKSKFYLNDNQDLMNEAIPRVISLVDAFFRKNENTNLLLKYGPKTSRKFRQSAYQSAVTENLQISYEIEVKNYVGNKKLRSFINDIVRFSENTLRSIMKHRGRLQGVEVDAELSIIIESFLKREYSLDNRQNLINNENKVNIDFSSIEILREQSEQVRQSLEVAEVIQCDEEYIQTKELLTDVKEVTEIINKLKPNAFKLFDLLRKNNWTIDSDSYIDEMSEINKLANIYISCNLIYYIKGKIVVEDDFVDELEYIFENEKELIKKTNENEITTKNEEVLSETLQDLFGVLDEQKINIIKIVVIEEDVAGKLSVIAKENFTMPQILIDNINEVAMQMIGDNLIDYDLRIVEEYKEDLNKYFKVGE